MIIIKKKTLLTRIQLIEKMCEQYENAFYAQKELNANMSSALNSMIGEIKKLQHEKKKDN